MADHVMILDSLRSTINDRGMMNTAYRLTGHLDRGMMSTAYRLTGGNPGDEVEFRL